MHPESTAAGDGGVCCSRLFGLGASPACATRAGKVLGLGSPVSVRIRFDAREVPVMRGVLDVTIERRDADRASQDELGELRRMRESLGDGDGPGGAVVVVWATALAYGVLREATQQAADRLHDELADLAAVEAIGDALDALACCLASWAELRRVDGGGLPEVWL